LRRHDRREHSVSDHDNVIASLVTAAARHKRFFVSLPDDKLRRADR